MHHTSKMKPNSTSTVPWKHSLTQPTLKDLSSFRWDQSNSKHQTRCQEHIKPSSSGFHSFFAWELVCFFWLGFFCLFVCFLLVCVFLIFVQSRGERSRFPSPFTAKCSFTTSGPAAQVVATEGGEKPPSSPAAPSLCSPRLLTSASHSQHWMAANAWTPHHNACPPTSCASLFWIDKSKLVLSLKFG